MGETAAHPQYPVKANNFVSYDLTNYHDPNVWLTIARSKNSFT